MACAGRLLRQHPRRLGVVGVDAGGAGGRLNKGGSAAAGGAPARNGLRSAGVEGGALGRVGGLLAPGVSGRGPI